jgi:predicted RecB family nuclease
MRRLEGQLLLSPSDLTGYTACQHLTGLEVRVIDGELVRPTRDDPELDIIRDYGMKHETAQLKRFRQEGKTVVEVEANTKTLAGYRAAETATLEAMSQGADIIYQATFFDGRWIGHADFLYRVEVPSDLGAWSYEVADTKLAKRVKAAAVLQLCSYTEHVARLQGVMPAEMKVILGTGEEEVLRVADHIEYFRTVRDRFVAYLAADAETYPDPVEHCGLCRWFDRCDAERRADDHLSLVAGMRGDQVRKLNAAGITTVKAFANNFSTEVPNVNPDMLRRLHRQAALQVRTRGTEDVLYELLEPGENLGLALMPEPNLGDIFFDMEGDPFVGENGLEYLWGLVTIDTGAPVFTAIWSHNQGEEQAALEQVVDFILQRNRDFPGMHTYHYASYEKSRLTNLAARYGTRETEVDNILRGELLVDLYRVVKQALLVSQESYSIKKLEPLYMEKRTGRVGDAASSIVVYEKYLESQRQAELDDIAAYNRDDCISTWLLRNWLEARRPELERQRGQPVPRPEATIAAAGEQGAAAESDEERLREALLAGVPEDLDRQSLVERGQWILAHMVEWYRREARPAWWEYFERRKMTPPQLYDDSTALSGLEYMGEDGQVKKSMRHRFRYDPAQEHKVDRGSREDPTTGEAYNVVEVDHEAGELVLQWGLATEKKHPSALAPAQPYGDDVKRGAINRVVELVLDQGLEGAGRFRAIRDILLREPPRLGQADGTSVASVAASREELPLHLDKSYLAVQGPPGTGKTWLGARMIVSLLAAGKRVGISAMSHRALGNLLAEVMRCARSEGVKVTALQRCDDQEDHCGDADVETAKDNNSFDARFANLEVNLVAGTSWLLAREVMEGSLDHVFIDEAGQMSIADALVIATAADNLVLLGDPQQLPQVSRGTHPDEVKASVLRHVACDHPVMPPDLGLFLDTTWRMHPDVCEPVSRISYEGRLLSAPSTAMQRVEDPPFDLPDAGVVWYPIEHLGDRSWSPAEIDVVSRLMDGLIGREWHGADGSVRPLAVEDVLVIAPYNAQVSHLRQALPHGARVGTVDKFQGQEAPVSIYSLATSTPEDMPRGLDFLFNINRLNVALSRARGLSIVIASPALLTAQCRKPEDIHRLNALCTVARIAKV